MNPTVLGVVGPGFLNQVPTLYYFGGSLLYFQYSINAPHNPILIIKAPILREGFGVEGRRFQDPLFEFL